MPSSRPTSPSEPVHRARELEDEARNETQKALLLTEVAHIKFDRSSRKLCEESSQLIQQSRKLIERSRTLSADSAKRNA